ncbi:MAG: choice-of-anchor B family protein [Bacteroidota bacterium]
MKKLYLLYLLLAFSAALPAQDSLNMSVRGHLAYQQNLNDIWAYVDSSGGEWALVGVFNGVSIVDLADPSNPTEQFFLPGAGSTWRDLKTWNNYAYVSNETADGLRIIDLSDLPNSAPYKDTIINGITTIHNLWVDEFGYLYYSGDGVNAGLTILDLNSDPWNPSIAGVYNTTYVHDVYVRNNIAYAAEIYDGELTVLDVSNKSNILTLGSQTYVNAFTHNTWLDSTGTICFTTDELDAAYIYSWDVSDPNNIQQLDRIRSSLSEGAAVPHNTHYLDDFLVTSYYADGMHIIDAHRPQNLVEVGYYDTSPSVGGGTFGCWGAYPFLPSGLVLGTDMGEGLFVFDVNYKRAAYLEGVATDAVTTNTVSSVDISVMNTALQELTANDGSYATGTPDSGSFTVEAIKFGYLPQDTVLTLSPGQVTVWNPVLVPAPAVGVTIRVEDANTGNPIPNADVLTTSLGVSSSVLTNTSGEYVDANFLQGGYEIIAGKWGYVTDGTTANIDSANNVVVIQLQPGYYDDYVFDFGWTATGTASEGDWERGEPVGTYVFGIEIQRELDAQDDWGDACYVTGNAVGVGTFDDDVDQGEVSLESPVMDLSAYNNPWIIFDWSFLAATAQGNPGFRDSLKITLDNGNTRQLVWVERDILNNFWTRDTIRLTDFMLHTSTVTFTISAADNQFDNIVEAALDVFRIEDQSTVANTPPLPETDHLQVFPNPSEGAFSLRYDLGTATSGEVRIYDLEGRVIWQAPLDDLQGTLTMNRDLPQGMYIAELISDGVRLETVKVVRQ